MTTKGFLFKDGTFTVSDDGTLTVSVKDNHPKLSEGALWAEFSVLFDKQATLNFIRWIQDDLMTRISLPRNYERGSIASSHIVGYVKEQTLHGSYFIKDESLSKDFNKNYCCDCEFIGKPSGAYYEPHPGSICLCNQVESDNYVTRVRHNPSCSNINHDGMCKYFQAKEGK